MRHGILEVICAPQLRQRNRTINVISPRSDSIIRRHNCLSSVSTIHNTSKQGKEFNY